MDTVHPWAALIIRCAIAGTEMSIPQQLPLGVSLRDDATFDNFYLSESDPNRQVVALLQSFASGQNPEAVIYIWGMRVVASAICYSPPVSVPRPMAAVSNTSPWPN